MNIMGVSSKATPRNRRTGSDRHPTSTEYKPVRTHIVPKLPEAPRQPTRTQETQEEHFQAACKWNTRKHLVGATTQRPSARWRKHAKTAPTQTSQLAQATTTTKKKIQDISPINGAPTKTHTLSKQFCVNADRLQLSTRNK